MMGDQTVTTIHLHGKEKLDGFSGRAVRYRIFDIDEMDEVERAYGHELRSLPAEQRDHMSMAEYQRGLQRYGLPKMIHSFTDSLTPAQFAAREGKWTMASPEMFDEDNGGLKQFFRAKDISVLRQIFMTEHDVGQKEVEGILSGKVETQV